jgi:hypothetical protein
MLFAEGKSGCFAVIPRNNSAQPLFPFNFALVGRNKIHPKNLVPDIRPLMRSVFIIIQQPLVVDIVKMVQAEANKIIKALSFYFSDAALAKSVCLRSPHRRFKAFNVFRFPEISKPCRELGVPIMDKVCGTNSQILKPHGRITGLLGGIGSGLDNRH